MMPDRTSRSPRAPGRDPLAALGAIFVALLLLLLTAFYFAPKRPEAPERSVIEYAERPGQTPGEFAAFPEMYHGAPGRQGPADASAEPDEEASRSVVRLHGVVTVKDGQTPITRAQVWAGLSPEAARELAVAASEAAQDGREEESQRHWRRMNLLVAGVTAHTNRDGRYALRLAGPGVYVVRVEAPGFVSFASDAFEIADDERDVRRDFALSRGASVAGRVTERGANGPAPNIEVNVFAVETEQRHDRRVAVTDSDGNYEVIGLTPGTYRVSLNLHDVPYLVAGAAPSQDVRIPHAEARVSGVNFVVEPAGVVWGYVQRADNREPVSGAVMLTTSQSPVAQALSAFSQQTGLKGAAADDEGYYEIVGVPLRREWRVQFMRGAAAAQLSDPFMLTPEHRSIRVDLNVFSGTRIFGRVVDQGGRPVPEAGVACLPTVGRFLRPMDNPLALEDAVTDEDGLFEFAHIPRGDYQILAHREGYKLELSGARVYSSGHGQVGPLNIVLWHVESGRYSVYGYVTDSDRRGIGEATLHLAGMSGGRLSAESRETKTDRRGYFVFYGIDPGYYILTAEKEGYESAVVREVQLDAPNNIVLRQTTTIEGVLLARDTREAPEGGRVRAMPQDVNADNLARMFDGAGMGHVDRNGRFSMRVTPGSYMLHATAPQYRPQSVAVDVSSRGGNVGTIYLDRATGRISGEVRVVDGSSPAGTQVRIGPAGRSFLESLDDASSGDGLVVRVGADGRFSFENLPPATYQVFARMPGFPEAHSAPVDLGDGQRVSGLVVMIGRGGTFEGYVMHQGAVAPDAVVTVSGNGYTNVTSTDHNGFYRIEGIPAGAYMAMAARVEGVTLGAFAPMHTAIEIAEGQTTVHNFGEERGVLVAGEVVPPPRTGTLGYAVATVPGMGEFTGMRLNSPASWFTGADAFGAYMIDAKPITSGGRFALNMPPGEYELFIIYATTTQLIAGDVRPVHSQPIQVPPEGLEGLYINLD